MGRSSVIEKSGTTSSGRRLRTTTSMLRARCEGLLADPEIERWLVTSMLEDLG